MEPPSSASSPAPLAVRRGPFVPAPGPDPREVMASIERRVRELAVEAPISTGPLSMRGNALARALGEVPMSS